MANRVNAIAAGVGSLDEVFNHYRSQPECTGDSCNFLERMHELLYDPRNLEWDITVRKALIAAFLNADFETSHRLHRVSESGIVDQSYIVGNNERATIADLMAG